MKLKSDFIVFKTTCKKNLGHPCYQTRDPRNGKVSKSTLESTKSTHEIAMRLHKCLKTHNNYFRYDKQL